MAGGFTISKQHFSEVHEALVDDLKDVELDTSESVIPITLNDTTIPDIEALELLAPFGQDNEAPLFMMEHVPFTRVDRLSEGKHLKIHLNDEVAALAYRFFIY